jgi:acetyltransferase-like isoleucine patch superfamily enzyme
MSDGPLVVRMSARVADWLKSIPLFLDHPAQIDGKWQDGRQLSFAHSIFVEPYATFTEHRFWNSGAFSYSRSPLPTETEVGRYCSIAEWVYVMGIHHPIDRISTHVFTFREYFAEDCAARYQAAPTPVPFAAWRGPLRIGHDVWIGQNVVIQQGISIGDGAIIAAGSVVTKDVAPYTIVAGVPASIVRNRFSPEQIVRIRASQWWRYHARDFDGLDLSTAETFLDGFEPRVANGEIQPWEPEKIDLREALAPFAE